MPVIRHGALEFDPASLCVRRGARTIALSAREGHPDRPLRTARHRFVARAAQESVYGWNEEVDSNAIEFHIHNLRKKLGQN